MSTILDALRKAEQERELGKVPNLRHLHTPGPTPTWRAPWWGIGTALLSGVLLSSIIMYQWLSPAVVPSTVQEPPTGPNPSEIPAPVILSESLNVIGTAPAPPPAAINPVPEAQPMHQAQTGFSQPVVPPTPGDLHEMAPDVLMNLGETAPPSPLSAMPTAFQNSLPPMNLDVHVYSDDIARRFVLINGQRYREGDWLQEGPLLETIMPEGIIMNHQQTRFSLAIER